MVSISINVPEDMLAEIESFIDDSTVFESRSQYFRACHREFQKEDESGLRRIE